MMLTKFDRQAFVRAVMDDVPKIDYEQQAVEKARSAANSLMPPEVAAAYAKFPNYFRGHIVALPGSLPNIGAVNPEYYCLREEAPEVWAELEKLSEALREQNAALESLEQKLTATIGACRTLKQAKELLPEFEKYLPVDRGTSGTKNLPVANLVAELNAAGWPKSEKKESN